MTIDQLRQAPGYKECLAKVRGYSVGFEFDVPFWRMIEAQKNGMHAIMRDFVQLGLIESVSISLDINFDITEERYKRI